MWRSREATPTGVCRWRRNGARSPEVTAAVAHIVPIEAPQGVEANVMERLTEAAFGQRRKMLRSSLKQFPGAAEAAERLGIDLQRRAETLSIDEFVEVARELSRT